MSQSKEELPESQEDSFASSEGEEPKEDLEFALPEQKSNIFSKREVAILKNYLKKDTPKLILA